LPSSENKLLQSERHLEEKIMTSFVNIQYANEHPGVSRIEAAIEGALVLRKRWSPARATLALLLCAVLAAVLVVGYQVMDSLAEGHLLVLWIALWLVSFAALALLSGTVNRLIEMTRSGLDGWAQRQARDRADQRLWRMAQSDSRVMADLQMAFSRQNAEGDAQHATAGPQTVLTQRALRLGSADLRAFLNQLR
jgi:hypothetical protein